MELMQHGHKDQRGSPEPTEKLAVKMHVCNPAVPTASRRWRQKLTLTEGLGLRY